jgi:hypothetical protein
VVKDLIVLPNKKLLDYNYTLLNNDGIHPLAYSTSIQTFAVFTKMWAYITIKIPESKDDKNFGKEVIKVVINVEKSMSGMQNNIVISRILDMLLEGTGLDLRFPMKKVSVRVDHLESS